MAHLRSGSDPAANFMLPVREGAMARAHGEREKEGSARGEGAVMKNGGFGVEVRVSNENFPRLFAFDGHDEDA